MIDLKRKVWSDKDKIEFLETLVKSVFGYDSSLRYGGWDIELPSVVINNVNLNSDLLGILGSRVRGDFDLDFNTTAEIEKWNGKNKIPIGFLEIEFWKRCSSS